MQVRIGSTASAGTCPSAGQGALDAPGAHSFGRAGVKVSGALKHKGAGRDRKASRKSRKAEDLFR